METLYGYITMIKDPIHPSYFTDAEQSAEPIDKVNQSHLDIIKHARTFATFFNGVGLNGPHCAQGYIKSDHFQLCLNAIKLQVHSAINSVPAA